MAGRMPRISRCDCWVFVASLAVLLVGAAPALAQAQGDPWVKKAAAPAENRTPVFSHPQQDAASAKKLA